MAEDSVELARTLASTYNEGGVEALVELVHPEFEGVVPPEVSLEPDTYRGLEGVRRYFASWAEGIEDLRIAVGNLSPVGPQAVVAEIQIHGRGRESGVEAALPAITVMRFKDDRLIGWMAYTSLDEAFAAAEAAR